MNELLLLCWEFSKMGLFAVGGGMSTIPFLTRMMEKHPHWFTLHDLADMIAVSESTPGPIGINMATYVGFKVGGVAGGILASLSMALPSFILLLFIASALEKYRRNTYVNAAFSALRPAVTGLIAAAGYMVLPMALFPNGTLVWPALILFMLLLAATQWKKLSRLHPTVYIFVAAIAGIVLKL